MAIPDVYTDDNGAKVLLQHKGPAGPGVAAGGTTGQVLRKKSGTEYDTEWVNAPNGTNAIEGESASVTDEIILFEGITGKKAKRSNVLITDLATKSYADDKVAKVTGFGLSENNFSDADKAKLDALSTGGFYGYYATLDDLEDDTTPPQRGQYALVEVNAATLVVYFWDETNEVWTTNSGVVMSGQEIATALFNPTDSALYDQTECRIFTSTYAGLVDAHEAIISELSGVASNVASYGGLDYFSLVGTAVALAGTSDGLSNMVKAAVVSTIASLATNFDNGGASNGRLRFTATATRTFFATAQVSVKDVAGDTLVIALAKNGTVIQASRVLVKMNATGEMQSVSMAALVSLATNDYLEVYVGNTTDSDPPTVCTLAIQAALT